MEVVVGSGVVRKIASSGEDRRRLALEAFALSAAAHPGVVRLLDRVGNESPSELVFAKVAGGTLTDRRPGLDWCEIAGLGAALATTLADLQEIGVVHRSVSAEHVLLDESGRPVICGFGNAIRFNDLSQARTAAMEDVASLAALLWGLGDEAPPRNLGSLLRSCHNQRAGSRSLTARRLARLLVETVPSARLPGSEPIQLQGRGPESPLTHACRRTSRVALALLGALAAISSALGFGAIFRILRVAGDGARCPSVDAGCSDRAVSSGSVISTPTGEFMLVGTKGVEVIGRWNCSEIGFPAVMNIADGEVWVFDRWPTDPSGIAARLVGQVPGASGLSVRPASGGRLRCDTLLVERGHRSPVVINLSRP